MITEKEKDSIREQAERIARDCTLYKPLMMVIPPEGTVIRCPVHEQGHFIMGPRPTW